MSDGEVFPVPEAWARRAHMDAAAYDAAWKRVEADPQGFWRDVAGRIDWIKPFTKVKNVSWNPDNLFVKWFEDGTTNELVISIITLGEGLHNNHHRFPRDAYISHAWYEIDINGLIIRGLEKLGLVHDVFDGGRASAVSTAGQTSEAV